MKKIIAQAILVVIITCLFVLLFLYGSLHLIYHSDNEKTKEILTLSLLETSAAKFVPTLFLTQDTIVDIVERNSITYQDVKTDENLIEVEYEGNEEIQVVEISGATYKGRMMIINDPSRVYLATPDTGFGGSSAGLTVAEYVERDHAVAGINAGGFEDKNGRGNGSVPSGYVIENSEITYGDRHDVDCVTGFDSNYKLIVGKMSAEEALNQGIVNGLCFNLSGIGPLIMNGEPIAIDGTGGGLNPRTAIGQRGDGTIILLNIDGRQAHSIGASYHDIIEIFLEQGVVNASNLDGGSSAMMIYQGEVLSVSSSLVGVRQLPTAFLVK
ncbi:MAG: phosphodiester glycosidase family protein [Eubacteriales bacterium]